MISISLCMVVKNNEDTLNESLKSCKGIIDEIIIVDLGSTDKTIDIAKTFTDNFYEFDPNETELNAKNFACRIATCDYIFWLNPQDIIYEEARKEINKLKSTLSPNFDYLTMNYNTRPSNHREIRLFKKTPNFDWNNLYNNKEKINKEIIDTDITIHKKNQNLDPVKTFQEANDLYENNQFFQALTKYKSLLENNDIDIEYKIYICGILSDYYLSHNKMEKALKFILKSFEYSTPRAEFCCRLGFYFFIENKIKQAKYWYKLATNLEKPEDKYGFLDDAYWTWSPYMQLSMCYIRQEDYERAYKYNEKALQLNPDSEQLLNNKIFLETRMDSLISP